MIKQVKHVSIPVKNQDRAIEFYANTLGFEIVCDAPFGDNQRWIEVKIPGSETQLVLFTPQGHEDRAGTFSNIMFNCDDIETTYQKMKERGVEFMHPPKQEPWGTFTIFKDCEGNSFCLSSS